MFRAFSRFAREFQSSKIGVSSPSSLSLSLIIHIFNGLQFTNQIAVGGDNADTVYFSLEPRDLVERVDRKTERDGWGIPAV